MTTHHICQHALIELNPFLSSISYSRKIPLANLAHVHRPGYLGYEARKSLWREASGAVHCMLTWPPVMLYVLLCSILYKLRSHALLQRKPFLCLMTGLDLGCRCHAPWRMWSLTSYFLLVLYLSISPVSALFQLIVSPLHLFLFYFWTGIKELLLSVCLHCQTIVSMRAQAIPVFSASYFPCQAQCMVHDLSKFIFINLLLKAVLDPDYALGARAIEGRARNVKIRETWSHVIMLLEVHAVIQLGSHGSLLG